VLYASLAVTHLSDTAALLVDQNATRVQLVLQAESNFNSAAVSEKNVILSAADEKAAKAAIEAYNAATAATLDAIGHFETIAADPEQHALIETFRGAVVNRREASAHVFELATAGKVDEAFAYSRGVAAKHRQVAMAAVGKLITMNVDKMQAARDASVAMATQTRTLLMIGATAGAGAMFQAMSSLGFNAQDAYGLLKLDAYSDVSGVKFLLNIDVASIAEVDQMTPKAVSLGAQLIKSPYKTYYNWYQAVLLDPEQNVFRINHMME